MATYTATTPGVLSTDDYYYCFQIAGVIWDALGRTTTASIHDGFGTQLSITDISILQNDLRNRLASFDTTTITHIQNEIITPWVPLLTNTTEMKEGGAGSISGLEYSPDKKREQIKLLFAGTTGCLAMAQALLHKKRAMEGDVMASTGSFVGVMRG